MKRIGKSIDRFVILGEYEWTLFPKQRHRDAAHLYRISCLPNRLLDMNRAAVLVRLDNYLKHTLHSERCFRSKQLQRERADRKKTHLYTKWSCTKWRFRWFGWRIAFWVWIQVLNLAERVTWCLSLACLREELSKEGILKKNACALTLYIHRVRRGGGKERVLL